MSAKYFHPKKLEECIEILSKYKSEYPELLAGGTDLMVRERDNYLNTEKEYIKPLVVNINNLKNEIGLIQINQNKVEIGALVTYTDILESEIIKNKVPIIAKASYTVGGRQIQNMGTIGGMLGTSTPAADLTLALLVMDADIILQSKEEGHRKVKIVDFFTGYRQTIRRPDEIITKVIVPFQKEKERFFFKKIGGRKGQIIAISNVCARIIISEDNLIKSAYISLGSSAPISKRLYRLEEFIKDKYTSDLSILEKEINKKIEEEISPIDEVIASGEYKAYVVKNLILDFLLDRI